MKITPPQAPFVRERQIKKWNRAWKIGSIEENNPWRNDLHQTLNQ
jgi:putative endonuclease